MRFSSTRSAHGLSLGALRVAAVAVLVLAAALTAHGQDEVVLIPAPPAPGAVLTYDIPLEPWLIPDVLALQEHFSNGLATEFSRIAETQTGEDVTALIGAGRDLEAAGVRVREAMAAMSAIDVTFGIDGIARILPAESAIRDTFFGFVVWHETSRMDARPALTQFEDLTNRVYAGTEAGGDLADELASAQELLSAAVEAGDATRIAELSPTIVQTSQRIDGVCGSMSTAAGELLAVIAGLSENTGSPWKEAWADIAAAVESTLVPAQSSHAALESVSDVLTLLVVLGEQLDFALSSVAAFQAVADGPGPGFVPWTVLRSDWKALDELDALVGWSGETVAEGHEGHGHEETHGRASLALTDESREVIRALFPSKVEASAMIAKAAVEHASTAVAQAQDLLEDKHMRDSGFSTELSERRQRNVLQKVDEAMRANLELVSAKLSARSARAAYGKGATARAAGSAVDATYWYHNAWLHSLNGGAAAGRVVSAARPG